MVYLSTNFPLTFGKNLRKYTSPMDGMENVGTPTSHSNSSSTTVAGSAAEAWNVETFQDITQGFGEGICEYIK